MQGRSDGGWIKRIAILRQIETSHTKADETNFSRPFLFWADIAAPALALGQAIGRWGNFVNQELYGLPTSLPWGIYIDPQHRLPGVQAYEYFHPVFLYESLWSLGNMGFLLWLSRRYEDRLKPGDVFLTYLVIYPLGRFLIEFLRLDSAQVAGLNTNQTIMLIIAIVAAGLLVWRHRLQSTPVEESGEIADEPYAEDQETDSDEPLGEEMADVVEDPPEG